MSGTNREFYENILVEGTKKFSHPSRLDRKVYGRIYGKKDILGFSRYIDEEFEVPAHIRLIGFYLSKVVSGKIKRLIINMPPRHGKSQLVSRIFPLFLLGRNPKLNLILASYAVSLAERFTRWQREKILQKEFSDIFPRVHLSDIQKTKREWETTAGGRFIGTGVGGPITGTGADIAIVDDPYKNFEEANSETVQEAVWDWFLSTFMTRLHTDASAIVIHTRWHSNDLTGKLLERDGDVKDGGKWYVLKLPAIGRRGALWSDKFNLEYLNSIRASIGERLFMALYQQEPVDIVERLFGEVKFCEEPKNFRKFAYLDPAFGGGDYSALSVGGLDRDSGKVVINGGWIWKGQIDITYNKVEQFYKNENISVLYVESNQAQRVIISELKKRGLNVQERNNVNNKHLRIVNFVKTNWNDIYFTKAVDPEYLKQVLNYSEHSKHDDAPDSLAGLIAALGFGRPSIENRYDGFLNNLLNRLR